MENSLINYKLIVQIPTYNEAPNIGAVIANIPRQIPGISNISILVVDDGSTDNTVELARQAGADYVLTSPYNQGLGLNFKKGLDYALSLGADIIVNIDGDNQFNAQEIPLLLQPLLEQKADMVTGSRFMNQANNHEVPTVKIWGNNLFTKLVSFITGQKFTDTQCGFRAYSREAALRLNTFAHFTYTQESFIDLLDKNLIIKEVPITVRYFADRHSHVSGNLIKYGLQALGIIAKATRDTQPMMFFGGPGLLAFGLGFIGGLYSLFFWLTYFITYPIRTLFTVSVFLVIFGVILIVFGLLADMIKRSKKTQEEILYRLKKNELPRK